MDETTLLFAAARFASAVGRLCLGPFLPLLTEAFDFPESSKPTLLSSYSSGYILTQIVGGYLADVYGFAIVTAVSVGLSAMIVFYVSSLASTVTQWTHAFFLLGLLAGPLFPAGSAAISSRVPLARRAASAAMIDASASAGTTVASLAPLLAVTWGWRWIYHMTGLCLAGVAVAAWKMRPDTTTNTKRSYHSPAMLPQKNENGSVPGTNGVSSNNNHKSLCSSSNNNNNPPLSALFLPVASCAYLCHCVDNFTKYSLNAWAATMLVTKHGASQELIGSILGFQEAVGVLSKALVGIWCSSLPASFQLRGTVSAMAFLVQAGALATCFVAQDWTVAALCMVVSSCAVGAHSIGFRPIYFEASPSHAGAVSGMGNTIASFASILGPVVIGSFIPQDAPEPHQQPSPHHHGDTWWNVALWMLCVNGLGAVAASAITLFVKGGGGGGGGRSSLWWAGGTGKAIST